VAGTFAPTPFTGRALLAATAWTGRIAVPAFTGGIAVPALTGRTCVAAALFGSAPFLLLSCTRPIAGAVALAAGAPGSAGAFGAALRRSAGLCAARSTLGAPSGSAHATTLGSAPRAAPCTGAASGGTSPTAGSTAARGAPCCAASCCAATGAAASGTALREGCRRTGDDDHGRHRVSQNPLHGLSSCRCRSAFDARVGSQRSPGRNRSAEHHRRVWVE
jgi:hypothetical protein